MHRPSRLPWLLLGALAMLATGCELSFGTDVRVEADGSGTVEVAIATDEELATLLAEAGVDLRLGLEEAAAAASPTWELTELDGIEEGAVGVRLRSTFDDPAQLASRVAELQEGAGPEDGSLIERLDLEVDPDGAVRFRGAAGLLVPTVPGAEGDGIAFDGDDLARLLAERGDDLVTAELRVTFPGAVEEHDGDELAGRSVTWRLPAGQSRELSASAAAPTDRTWALAVGVAVLAAAGAAVLTLGFRVVCRRRFRRGPLSGG
jgi:hypothetical protein